MEAEVKVRGPAMTGEVCLTALPPPVVERGGALALCRERWSTQRPQLNSQITPRILHQPFG